MPDATGKRWYLVQCKPRQDFRAQEHLERQGYQCLLFLHQVERKGKVHLHTEPLFPGYLFIQLDHIEDNWLPIRSTRGVNQIVSFGGRPTPIADTIISDLRTRENTPPSPLSLGDQVMLTDSNMQQLEAIFLEGSGEGRVLILLNILQRDIKINIATDRLVRVDT